MTENIQNIRQRFIEAAGHMTQSLGAGRALGQVFAYLYFNKDPQSLDDLAKVLEISKGSASMTVRQLEQWGALRRIWIKGDRKDYYEAEDWFGRILKNVLVDMLGKRISSFTELLEGVERELATIGPNDGEGEFVKGQIRKLREFQSKTVRAWENPLVKGLLK